MIKTTPVTPVPLSALIGMLPMGSWCFIALGLRWVALGLRLVALGLAGGSDSPLGNERPSGVSASSFGLHQAKVTQRT
jgi:hypothetical protein